MGLSIADLSELRTPCGPTVVALQIDETATHAASKDPAADRQSL